MQIIFLACAGIATILFVLFLFSLFGRSPGDDVRERMEQYLTESEKASKTGTYEIPEEALEADEEANAEEEEGDDWTSELRGKKKKGHEGAKRILANMGTILTPKGMAAKIADQLAKADIPLKANEFVAIQFLAVMIAMMIGTIILKNLVLALGLAVIAYFLPLIWVSIVRAKRKQAFNDQILDTLIMIANGLKAGYSFLQALEMVSKESLPPMSKELKRVLKENSLGMNLEDTLMALNSRVESEDWDLVTTVVLIQRQVGGNLAEVLEKIGKTIRERMRIKGDIQTNTAQAKVSGLLVAALPFGLGVMIYVLNPEFMSKLFTFKMNWFRGWFLVIGGLIWEAIGMLIIKKIVDIEV
ncbi:MAG: type II secretion system F family protein [Candidatus Riflebacteria bacterium]|nr:type II secretion system F family protein [Candidatus Riflebacteria bacterium]